ncbi:hypothetical protein F751_1542 [Auxenochlorella protothecoides]|uniref:Uncharacterized protein n=1 Tax=Auxenochlorella protothecoides TaxID=3075 RepID=A0A087SRA9_AUXPR|nr:hypothetical protein F751_1542 [Auxenochlorella protothecoides]KFM28263.1 hypothetical protein F751_1542 [Auxenochlorella protothecoides]
MRHALGGCLNLRSRARASRGGASCIAACWRACPPGPGPTPPTTGAGPVTRAPAPPPLLQPGHLWCRAVWHSQCPRPPPSATSCSDHPVGVVFCDCIAAQCHVQDCHRSVRRRGNASREAGRVLWECASPRRHLDCITNVCCSAPGMRRAGPGDSPRGAVCSTHIPLCRLLSP